jgi:hypothetical protein
MHGYTGHCMSRRITSKCLQNERYHVHISHSYALYIPSTGKRGPVYLHSDHNTCVFVPAQQWVIPILRTRFCNVRSTCHKVLVEIGACEATGDGCIHGFHNLKVGGEEYVEIALMYLSFTLAANWH